MGSLFMLELKCKTNSWVLEPCQQPVTTSCSPLATPVKSRVGDLDISDSIMTYMLYFDKTLKL